MILKKKLDPRGSYAPHPGAIYMYGGTFEIRGNSKFGVIYIFNSFSLSVKCSEKILTSVETLMFTL